MADISWKRTGTLVRKLVRILICEPEGLRAADALARVAEGETLSDYEAGTYKSGGRRFEIIIRWATVDLVKAGWLLKQKGVWSVTELGKQAYNTWADPEAFYKEANRLYREWKDGQAGQTDVPSPSAPQIEDDQSEKSSSITYEQADEQAWDEISAHVGGMDPYDFQDLVGDLLKAMGYYQTWVAPRGPDGGVDIIAYPDPLGTRAPRIKVQVKRQRDPVDVDGVRSFLSLVNEDDAGLFVCTGGFKRTAYDLVRTQERRKITLINLEGLIDLWIEFYGKLTDRARERMPLTPIYFLTPRE